MQRLVAGSDEHFASGPGKFIIVHELISIMGQLLIRAVRAEAFDCPFEKIPPLLRLLQVNFRRFRKLFLELRRRSALS